MFIFGSHVESGNIKVLSLHYRVAVAYSVAAFCGELFVSKQTIEQAGLPLPHSLAGNRIKDKIYLYEYIVQLTYKDYAEIVEFLSRDEDLTDAKYKVIYTKLLSILLAETSGEIAKNVEILIEEILREAEQKLLKYSVESIIELLFDTPVVKEKVKQGFLLQFRAHNNNSSLIGSDNYYLVEDMLLQDLKSNNYTSNNKLEGDDSNLNGLIMHKIKLFISARNADIYALFNVKGSKSSGEEDFSEEDRMYIDVSSQRSMDIDFHEVMGQLHWLQDSLFRIVRNSSVNHFKGSYSQEFIQGMEGSIGIQDTKFYRQNLVYQEQSISGRGNVYFYTANIIQLMQDYDLILKLNSLKLSNNTNILSLLSINLNHIKCVAVTGVAANDIYDYIEVDNNLHQFISRSALERRHKLSINKFNILYKYAMSGVSAENISTMLYELHSKSGLSTNKSNVLAGKSRVYAEYYEGLPIAVTSDNVYRISYSENDNEELPILVKASKIIAAFLSHLASKGLSIHDIDPKIIFDKQSYLRYKDIESLLLFSGYTDTTVNYSVENELLSFIDKKHEGEIYMPNPSFVGDSFSEVVVELNLQDYAKKVIHKPLKKGIAGNKREKSESKFLKESVLLNWLNEELDNLGLPTIDRIASFDQIIDIQNPDYNSLTQNMTRFAEVFHSYQRNKNMMSYTHESMEVLCLDEYVLVQSLSYFMAEHLNIEMFVSSLTRQDISRCLYQCEQYIKDYDFYNQPIYEYRVKDTVFSGWPSTVQQLLDAYDKNTNEQFADLAIAYYIEKFTRATNVGELFRYCLVTRILYDLLEAAMTDFIRRCIAYHHTVDWDIDSARESKDKDLDYGEKYNEFYLYLTLRPHEFIYKLWVGRVSTVRDIFCKKLNAAYLDVVPRTINRVEDYAYLDNIIIDFKKRNEGILEKFAIEYKKYCDKVYNNYFFGEVIRDEDKALMLINTLKTMPEFHRSLAWSSISIKDYMRENQRAYSQQTEFNGNLGFYERRSGFIFENDKPVTKHNKDGDLLVLHETKMFFGINRKGVIVCESSKKQVNL